MQISHAEKGLSLETSALQLFRAANLCYQLFDSTKFPYYVVTD